MPRVDRERNRIRLMESAARVLRRDGPGASMRAIAREADLGIATAYRHFPTRDDLVEAVLAAQVERCTTAIRAALREPDAWNALRLVIDWFAELQITHPGLLRILIDLSRRDQPFAEARREHAAALDQLVARAHSSGTLRPGVNSDDIRVGMMAMTAFANGAGTPATTAVPTLRDILIHGITAAHGERT